jgi:hypothetical protein
MESFIQKHEHKIQGSISCFDRLLYKGYLPFGFPAAMERFMNSQGLLLKEFKPFVKKQSDILVSHAKAIAEKSGRPYIYLPSRIRKEDEARAMACRENITEGLVCIYGIVEAAQSFGLAYGQGRPRIKRTNPRCLCLYYYLMHKEFGLVHIRIQSWFPFTVQVYLNGHDWLSRKLDERGIKYKRMDNAFFSISDTKRAQRIADKFAKRPWPKILSSWAKKVNPLMKTLLRGLEYYWVIDQAEYATDIMFRDLASLKGLYKKLLEHSICSFSAEDILQFLGKKLHGAFRGEVLSDYKAKRVPGSRVKHRMKENWIKMYDKNGLVLRIETVINRPYDFKVRRRGIRKGKEVMGWYPMAKGVSNLPRYMEVSRQSNGRYLEALSVVSDPAEAIRLLPKLAASVRKAGHFYRGFNPADVEDIKLFSSVLRGEYLIMGFRNKDIRERLFRHTKDIEEGRRQSARVSRVFKRLHVRGLIAKFPHSRRWRVTKTGRLLMSMAVTLFQRKYIECLEKAA